jgi:hypothetical protein
MAKYHDQQIANEFNRQMQLLEYQFALDKERFDQEMSIANYNLQLEKSVLIKRWRLRITGLTLRQRLTRSTWIRSITICVSKRKAGRA